MAKNIVVIESHKHTLDKLAKIKKLSKITKQVSSNHKSPNTLNGYASDWEDFDSWCNEHGFQSLPAAPQVVASYLADRAWNKWVGPSGRLRQLTNKKPLKLPTLLHRVWGIRFKHKENGYPFDTSCKEISDVLDSLRRNNTAKEDRKDPLLLNDIVKMSEHLQTLIKDKESNPIKALIAIRDRALLLIGFIGAMRRAEIAALSMDNFKFVEEGIELHITQSKTGARELVIPYGSNPLTCPVRSLKAWLNESAISDGAIFRPINKHGHIKPSHLTGAAVALIVKRNAHVKFKIQEAHQRGEYIPSYAGHSLRAGFVTEAAQQEIPEDLIMAQTGHKKSDTVKKYIRRANKWQDNAAIRIGL